MKRMKILGLVLIYYVLSLSLGYLSSFVLSKKNYNFAFPLFKASIQNFIHYTGASIILRMRKEKPPKPDYLGASLPCAIAGALDIGLSSYSLRTVTLAFFTMVKSSSPVFILLCGFSFGIEKPSILFFLIIFTIGAGVFLTSIRNTDFDLFGFNILLLASFMAGFRWSFIQYLIQKGERKSHGVFVTMRDLYLPITIFLICLSWHFEGIIEIAKSKFFNTFNAALKNFCLIATCGLLSFSLLCAEFYLISETSVVFLSVAGIVKELIIVIYAIFRKEIVFIYLNYVGLIISICGILMYSLTRKSLSRK